MSIFALLASGCSAIEIPQFTNKITPTRSPLPACESSEFLLPQSVLVAAQELDRDDYRDHYFDRFEKQHGWLSVHLDLPQSAIRYADPIPFRLTIINEKDYPVIFVRPDDISFRFHPNIQLRLRVEMISFAGERISPRTVTTVDTIYIPPPPERFSMLPPEKSCIMDLQLMWNETVLPLEEPIPPGDYRMSVTLRQLDLGPRTREYGDLDIGAWVGATEPSNVVTVTIQPPAQ